jgi:hypothetical protein
MLGSVPCSKNIGDGPIKMASSSGKEKKQLWTHISGGNRSMNKYQFFARKFDQVFANRYPKYVRRYVCYPILGTSH